MVRVARSLGRIGPDAADAVPAMLVSLELAVPGWRDEIREALDRIIPRAWGATITDSIAAMRSSDPAERYRAAYELGRLTEDSPPPTGAVAALRRAIDDPDARVRPMAVAGLGRLGTRAAAARPDLIRATRDPDRMARRLSAWALSRNTPRRGRPQGQSPGP